MTTRRADATTDSLDRASGARGVPTTSAGIALLYAPEYAALRPAYPLVGERVVVGRHESCAVQLPRGAVSRLHAAIERAPRDDRLGWQVLDLGSRNGTFVDGRRVGGEPVALAHGAIVRFGDSIFMMVDRHIGRYGREHIDGRALEAESARGRPCSAVPPGDGMPPGRFQMANVAAGLRRVAWLSFCIVLQGESGTGKELFAQYVHRQSGRTGPFCPLNCAAIAPNLFESELFGYRRGAFTGADRDKAGILKAASGGTVFLDEIGDMPLEAQAKLLRVIQAREVLPLGATAAEPVDVRFVCATHRHLKELVKQERFRGDLYARLSEFAVELPPLRTRREDTFLLVRHFLEKHGRPELAPSTDFMEALLRYDFPYNVRELESAVRRALAFCDEPVLEAAHLPAEIVPAPAAVAAEESAGPPTRAALESLLRANAGNVAAIARELKKDRMQIHRWLRRHGLDPDAFRGAER